jgi:hypothetical protein
MVAAMRVLVDSFIYGGYLVKGCLFLGEFLGFATRLAVVGCLPEGWDLCPARRN